MEIGSDLDGLDHPVGIDDPVGSITRCGRSADALDLLITQGRTRSWAIYESECAEK
jgi:hypothetical protein